MEAVCGWVWIFSGIAQYQKHLLAKDYLLLLVYIGNRSDLPAQVLSGASVCAIRRTRCTSEIKEHITHKCAGFAIL